LVNDWSAAETHAAWVRGEVAIVDVREQNEHDACRVADVPLVPLSELPGRVADLPVGRPLVVMCRSGQRSARVAQYLGENDWTDEVHNLEGGIIAWAAAGLPYEGETPR
jgi:rhodanese-related sulfurtransferase